MAENECVCFDGVAKPSNFEGVDYMITWIKSNRFLSIILLVCMGFFAYYIFNAVRWIPYPNSTDYGEGFVMNYAKLWANGTWKWDINVPPYLTMVYGVGFPILVEPLVKLFGAQLWVGRAVSFASALIVCGFLYLIVKEITGKRIYGLVAALIPATQPIFRDWSIMARVDMPAVMFDIMGLYLVVKLKNSRWMYLPVVPFICALMIKLSAIVGLVAVAIYLLIYNRRRLLAFLGLFLTGLAVVLTPLMITSGGTYWKHIILYQNTIENIDLPSFLYLFNMFIYPFLILLALAYIYLKRTWKKRDFTLVGIFLIVSLVIDIITTLRAGAASMYYFEAIMAVAICVPLALPSVLTYFKRYGGQIQVIAIAVVLVALFGVYGTRHNYPFPDAQYTKAVNDVQSIMSDSQKPLITEIPAISLTMGKQLYIEFFIFTNMSRLGYWDEAPYVEQYKKQGFDYVLLRIALDKRLGTLDGDFTSNALRAINDNYTLVYRTVNKDWTGSMFLYEANDKLKHEGKK